MLRSLLSLLSLLVLVVFLVPACGDPDGTLDDDDTADDDDDITPPDDDDDDDATADDDDATSAPATVVDVHPDDGTTDHYVHEAVWVDFSAAAEDAEISLADADGGAVDGDPIWLSETRLALNFDGLSFSTHYTATVTWAGGAETHSWEFDTSTVGETATEADLVGNTYAYDLAAGTVVAPVGGEDLLAQVPAIFLQGISSQTETDISFIGGIASANADPPTQDLCQPSVDLNANEPALWMDPYFVAGPADVPQQLSIPNFGDFDITFRDVVVSGVFASSEAGGPVDQILEGAFSTVIDVRDAGLGDVCDQLGLVFPGLTCTTCPHDASSDQCVIFFLIDLEASLVEGLTLVEWTEDDVATQECD